VLPPIRGARLMSFLDDKVEPPPEILNVHKDDKPSKEENPMFHAWVATDQ
jgi:hypothetical protein